MKIITKLGLVIILILFTCMLGYVLYLMVKFLTLIIFIATIF